MDEIVSIKDIIKLMREKGHKIVVYRLGKGLRGDYVDLQRATRNVRQPDGTFRADLHPDFWSLRYRSPEGSGVWPSSGETLSNGEYNRLEFVKAKDGEFHLIIPA